MPPAHALSLAAPTLVRVPVPTEPQPVGLGFARAHGAAEPRQRGQHEIAKGGKGLCSERICMTPTVASDEVRRRGREERKGRPQLEWETGEVGRRMRKP